MLKRLVDFLISLCGIIVLIPVLFLICIWIKMDSKGPFFYLQERVGKRGILFRLFKFRTMHINADKLTAITVGMRDPRITRAGYYIRKFKLDELPQLINVLKGEMSLVGPRPELKKFTDLYTPEQRKVLDVRPGITDYASLQFRNENELLEGKEDPVGFYIQEIMPVKLQLNLRYIAEQSLWVDVMILVRTVLAIVGVGK